MSILTEVCRECVVDVEPAEKTLWKKYANYVSQENAENGLGSDNNY